MATGAPLPAARLSATMMLPEGFQRLPEAHEFIEISATHPQRLSLTSVSSMPNAWDFPEDMMMDVEGSFNQTSIPANATLPAKPYDKTLFEGLRDARRSFAETMAEDEALTTDAVGQHEDVSGGPMRKRPVPHHHGRDLSLTSLGSLDLELMPPLPAANLITTPVLEEEFQPLGDAAEAARLAEEKLKREYQMALAERLAVFDDVVIAPPAPVGAHVPTAAPILVDEDMMDELLESVPPTAEEEEAWITQQQSAQPPTLGRFTAEERAARLATFRESRKKRVFNQVKYSLRQQACETRVREKSGRFTSKAAAAALLAEQQQQQQAAAQAEAAMPQHAFDEDVAQPPAKKQRRESVARLARMFVRRLSVSLFGSPGNTPAATKVPRRHTVMTLAHARELLEEDGPSKEAPEMAIEASSQEHIASPSAKTSEAGGSMKKGARRSTMPPGAGSVRRISWFLGGGSSSSLQSTPTSPAGGAVKFQIDG